MTRPTLLHVFSTFRVGGPQVRFAAIANRFPGRWRHLVAAMDDAHDAAPLLSPGVDLRILPLGAPKGATLSNAWAFRRLLGELRPDLLVTYNWGTIEWAIANLGALRPQIHVEDGFGPEEAAGQIRRRVMTRRLALRRVPVVLPSRNLLTIAEQRWRLPRANLIHLPNGIDPRRFEAGPDPALARRLRGERDEPVIGTVAALRPEKNLTRLLRAFAPLAERARLVIVGDGPERPGLQRLAEALGLADRVLLTGHLPDPARFVGAFDIFALSSDTEQMPMSVLEAMAAALPIAATRVGDVETMLAPDNRPFVVPPSEPALTRALERLLREPDAARRIGQANARRVRETYDHEAMLQSWATLFTPASQ
ncbi:MAG: glycosyltransferase [Alphaproteobacteria bacterium]|nr:glycosyltransferase [Alphaproteobacteria bacterium]